MTNTEAAIGARSDSQAVGNVWYGSKGYMSTASEGWQTFMGRKGPGPKSEAGAGVGGFVNFIDVVRSRNARISSRGRGRSDLNDADPPGQHLYRTAVLVFRSDYLQLQGRC